MQDTDTPLDRSAGPEAFLLEEYKHLTESFLRNEELGERRFNFFMALVAAVLVSVATVYKDNTSSISPLAVAFTAIILLVFGVLTWLRLIRRDTVTDDYKRGIKRIRGYFARRNVGIAPYLFLNPSAADQVHSRQWMKFFSLEQGGLTRTMELLNSVTAMILAGALVQADGVPNWPAASVPVWCAATVPAWLAVPVLAGFAALILQFVWVKWKYESAERPEEAAHGHTDKC